MITPPEAVLNSIKQRLAYCQETGKLTWVERCRRAWGGASVKPGDEAGSPTTQGYLGVRVDGLKMIAAHRIAWFLHYGQWPTQFIDHINGVKTDNRIANLRLASRSENQFNSRRPSNNSSGVKGVSYDITRSCWQAKISVHRKQIHLGRFQTKEAAAEARRLGAERYHREFARHE